MGGSAFLEPVSPGCLSQPAAAAAAAAATAPSRGQSRARGGRPSFNPPTPFRLRWPHPLRVGPPPPRPLPPKPLHQSAQNPVHPCFSRQASAAFLQASGRGDGPSSPRLSPRALRLQNQLQLHRQVPSPADRPESELPGEAGSRGRRGLVGGTSNGGQAGIVSPPSAGPSSDRYVPVQ